ncbi:MAG: HhH-GPD family protein [Planctomycetota bacterium]|jgi:A/G-specific adenine glycosylase
MSEPLDGVDLSVVSEVMLHQTQVSRVIEFYREFLKRWPSMKKLDEARLRDVKRLMDPLGYKRRSKYLKDAVREVRAEYGGKFPRGEKEILGLSGVGKYTAGAIRSFAFEQDAPICDTNVARVMARIFLGHAKAAAPQGDKVLWALAEASIPKGKARLWNNALMDLGATVCTAGRPKCGECPVKPDVCEAAANGVVESR